MVRFKNRYFTAEIIPTDGRSSIQPLNHKYELLKAIELVTEKIHGEFGVAALKNGLDVKYWNEQTSIAVIRCRHGPHRLLGSSLPFLSEIGKRKVQLQGIYTGASMVKCFRRIQKHHQEKINEALKNCKTEQQRRNILETMGKLDFPKK